MVCVGLSERDVKNFGGATGGARQNVGGAVAPLAPPLLLYLLNIGYFTDTLYAASTFVTLRRSAASVMS